MNHVGGEKTLEDFFSEEDQGELQKIRELQNQGYTLDIKHELGSIYGRVDLEDLSEIMENSSKIIDFLIEQGVSTDRILKLT